MTNDSKVQKTINKFSKLELGNIKVMMIEDDSFLSEMVLTKLSTHGCIPYSANNGSEALSLAEQYAPNIIILDLMLPGKSGEEILTELKAHPDLKQIPVIVFTNKSEPEDAENNLKAGAAAFLIKSQTDLNNLVEIVKDLTSKKH